MALKLPNNSTKRRCRQQKKFVLQSVPLIAKRAGKLIR